MTAIIGYCLSDAAYLVADSRRTEDTGEQSCVQKIENLKAGMVIATGGLGTEGDNTKKRMIDLVTKEMPLEEIIENAKKISAFEFSESFKKKPAHDHPLTCIIAGEDDHGRGFICALSSHSRNFDPYWVRDAGKPYFTGSNTPLVICIASAVIRKLKKIDEKLKFDKWAIESIKEISRCDRRVGFPLRIVCARKDMSKIYSIEEFDYIYREEFETEFPHL